MVTFGKQRPKFCRNAKPDVAEPDVQTGRVVAQGDDTGEIVQEDNNRGAVVAEATISFGPLPTPEEFKGYGEVLPNAPERILRMAEREQDMRHEGYRASISNDRLRINGSITVSLALIIAAVLVALIGYPWVSLPLGLSGIVAIIIRRIVFRQDSDAE